VLQAIRQGLKVPSRIADAPELFPWLRPVYNAFLELHTCRNDNGPIPWTALYSYAQAYGYAKSDSELHRFTMLMRGMDKAFIAASGDKQKKLHEAQARDAKKSKVKGRQ
jgi:hypothetical protein